MTVYLHKSILFRVLLLMGGVILMGMLMAFSGWYHPGCLMVEPPPENYVPAPPGLPCLPSTPPPSGGGTSDSSSAPGTNQGPIRLTIWNGSEWPFSITLTGPTTYVLNVASEETRTFVIDRGVYSFDMMLCRVGAQGVMALNKMTSLQFKPCAIEKLVEVRVENQTSEVAAVSLSGPGSFVFAIPAGETRTFTIPRGDYEVTQWTCEATKSGTFEARSHRTLELNCP